MRSRGWVTGVGVAGVLLMVGAGVAVAVDPTSLRDGCSYANSAEQSRNIQTCRVWSEAMQSDVVIKVRPSSQQAGQQEQAVYFLGGVGGGAEADGIAAQYDERYTLVQVVDGSNAWSANWESLPVDADGNTLTNRSGGTYDPQWETFIGEELPAYLEDDFSVEPTDNAIVGLSLGGGQAVNLALKYPEVFKVAHSISGYYQTDSVFGYLLIPYILNNRNGIANGFDGMWGNPFAVGNAWAENDVTRHIIEARDNGQIIIVSAGTGVLTGQDEYDELIGLGGIGEVIFGAGLETLSFASTLVLNGVAVVLDLPVRFNYTNGAHTWTHWNANAEKEADMVQDALEEFQRDEVATVVADGTGEALAEQVSQDEKDEAVTTEASSIAVPTSSAATVAPTSSAASAPSDTSAPASTVVPTSSVAPTSSGVPGDTLAPTSTVAPTSGAAPDSGASTSSAVPTPGAAHTSTGRAIPSSGQSDTASASDSPADATGLASD